MHRFLLGALLTSSLAFAGVGCGGADDDGAYNESALRKGTLPDGGSCRCAKEEKSKADAGKGKPEKAEDDGGKGKPEKAERDGGNGKPERDGGPGKSDEEHGKGGKGDAGLDEDEDEASEEDAADEEDDALLPRKVFVDGGVKGKKPTADEGCVCE